MASFSSPSASPLQQKHEVFISFRGEDTRNTFLSHLYQTLQQKGIGAFADFLPAGGVEISPALLKAIEEAMIALIIFSENYAASTWCLDELSKIMECKRTKGQLVVPIFYHVDPSQVRKQTGHFAEAFAKHEVRVINNDKVQRWRHALTEAGNLSGWLLAGDSPEHIIIEKIVQDILNKLNRMSKSYYRRLIGIDPQIEQIRSLLSIGEEGVRIIGIWGMGGIGKTILAEAIYNEISHHFESCCFLENVREESMKHGITFLRDKLFSKILEEENFNIGTPRIGSKFIIDRLQRKRVLVILDDVSDLDHLEILGISPDHFGSGSRIIVTSRDKQVLKNGVDQIYEVLKLNQDDSLQLFSLYAFKQSHPPNEDFKNLSNRVLEYAEGVPLALKVLGSALHHRSREHWESALNKLKQHPHPEIQSVLKISYDGLDDEEKNIFLDICCFYNGHNIRYAMEKLEARYSFVQSGIMNLVDKGLLTISSDTLSMHNLVQQMAWNIDPQRRRRATLHSPKKVKKEWMFLLINGVLEVLLVALDQCASAKKPHYSLMAVVVSIVAMFICIIELFDRGRKAKVVFKRRGLRSCFYHPSSSEKPFYSFVDMFSLICGISQYIFSIVAYCYYRRHLENPIKVSIVSVIFIVCMAFSKYTHNPNVVSPPFERDFEV